jgi:hypothetical protein
MTMPGRWSAAGLTDFAGQVRFRRRFGYPGRIDPHERIWLTFAGVAGSAEVWLNGHALGTQTQSPFELEVTALMKEHNILEVIVASAETDGGLWGEVAMEIRCTAYLRNVHAVHFPAKAETHVTGVVVGTCPGPLELYVLRDRATVGYAMVQARPEGEPFEMVLESDSVSPVRVELVNVATVWYAVEAKPYQPTSE